MILFDLFIEHLVADIALSVPEKDSMACMIANQIKIRNGQLISTRVCFKENC